MLIYAIWAIDGTREIESTKGCDDMENKNWIIVSVVMTATALLAGCCHMGTLASDKRIGGVECMERGDRAMAAGEELEAGSWYSEAEKDGVGLASTRRLLAERAMNAACAEPSPAVIDNRIYRALCSERIYGKATQTYDRLVARYSAEEPFSIADAVKMSREECHRFACELAVIGCMDGIGYLRTRKLIDQDDTNQGGIVHYAAIAGQELCVQWLVGVCCADPHKVDEKGKTPTVWVMREMQNVREDVGEDPCEDEVKFIEKLQRVKTYLITFERASDDDDAA